MYRVSYRLTTLNLQIHSPMGDRMISLCTSYNKESISPNSAKGVASRTGSLQANWEVGHTQYVPSKLLHVRFQPKKSASCRPWLQ